MAVLEYPFVRACAYDLFKGVFLTLSRGKIRGKNKMKAYHHNSPYSAKEKMNALKLLSHSTIEYVCHRYHCSERSLYRWKSKYNGTLESLKNNSSAPHTPHPKRSYKRGNQAYKRLDKKKPKYRTK